MDVLVDFFENGKWRRNQLNRRVVYETVVIVLFSMNESKQYASLIMWWDICFQYEIIVLFFSESFIGIFDENNYKPIHWIQQRSRLNQPFMNSQYLLIFKCNNLWDSFYRISTANISVSHLLRIIWMTVATCFFIDAQKEEIMLGFF
jgi:hypothetical protein